MICFPMHLAIINRISLASVRILQQLSEDRDLNVNLDWNLGNPSMETPLSTSFTPTVRAKREI
jgi:hypothetical protein